MWHAGPKFLYNSNLTTSTHNGESTAEMPPNHPEVRKDIKVFATHVEARTTIGSECFSRFSKWYKLQSAIAKLINVARSHRKACNQSDIAPAQLYHQAKVVIIKTVQYEAFEKTSSASSVPRNFPKLAS